MVIKKVFVVLFGMFFFGAMLSSVSAGVGIQWDRETSLVPENTETCFTYFLFNPFEGDIYAEIMLSEELENVTQYQESETKLIPEYTFRNESIPVEFCFKTPKIYERDCLIGGNGGVICKQDCLEDMKVYDGEVEVAQKDASEFEGSGSGGSKTALSVSAPLRVKVQCISHSRDFSLVYLVVAIVAGILLAINLFKSKKKKNNKKK